MERIFQTYQDLAEFRLIYISEAHAVDSIGSGATGMKPTDPEDPLLLGIAEHQSHDDRCTAASMLLDNKALSMPFLVDDMRDSVDRVYKAHPDRIFLVRKDGRLAIVAEMGPWGFVPALSKVERWLNAYRQDGLEPPLPDSAAEAGKELRIRTFSSK